MSASVQVGGSGSIAANSSTDFVFTVSPLAPGQRVIATPIAPLDASWAGLIWQAFPSATNTLTIRVVNPTTGSKTPVAQAFAVEVGRDVSLN